MNRVIPVLLLLCICGSDAAAQVAYGGCYDVNSYPVATVVDPTLVGDVAQATFSMGVPIIRYNPQSVVPGTPQIVLSWLYLHECAHHASGQVFAMLTGQIPYTMAIEIRADCIATTWLQQRAGPQAKLIVQQFLVALNNPGDQQHPPSGQRARFIAGC